MTWVMRPATLIVLSVGTGYLFSVGATFFYESEVFFKASAVLLVFILLGHWLEMRARAGASDAIRALMDLAPPTATVVRADVETQVPTAKVPSGEIVVIKPGDKIPVAGEATEGSLQIDESMLTGELKPVKKVVGNPVIRATINKRGQANVQSRFLLDRPLLERSAKEKLEFLAGPVRAGGWGWVEARVDVGAKALKQFAACPHVNRKLTADAQAGAASAVASPTRRARGCSEALTKRRAAHRTTALQAVLTQNTAVALAALVHVVVLRSFGGDRARIGLALQLFPQISALATEAAADDIKQSRAWQGVQQAKQAWRARLPELQRERLGWLIELPQAELLDLLALCCAMTVNGLPSALAAAHGDAIAAALGLDMADWWEPTGKGYLNHVLKAKIVQELKDAEPELARDGVESMKKHVLANTAASRLAGKRWLPPQWRQPPV